MAVPAQMPGGTTGPQSQGQGYLGAPQYSQGQFQPGYLPTPPQAQGTYYGGTSDPSQVIQQILQGFAPMAASSENALNSTLAASGLAGGPNVGAQTELQAQLASALAPSLANAIQFSQGQQQQAGLANTATANQFTLQNLMDLLNTQGQNTNTFNQFQQQGLGLAASPYQQMQGQAGNLALGSAQNFPIQQGASQGFSGLMGALGGMQSGGQNYSPFSMYQSPVQGFGGMTGGNTSQMVPQ